MEREGTHENWGELMRSDLNIASQFIKVFPSGLPPTLTLVRKELDRLQGSFPILLKINPYLPIVEIPAIHIRDQYLYNTRPASLGLDNNWTTCPKRKSKKSLS